MIVRSGSVATLPAEEAASGVRPAEEGTPLYVQLAEEVEGAILRGEYRAGDKLPAERALAERRGVSRCVAGKAMELLQKKGVVHRSRGRRGTTVLPAPYHYRFSVGFFRETESTGTLEIASPRRILSVRQIRAHERLAATMHVPVGERLLAQEQVRYARGVPLRYGTVYAREGLFPGLHNLLLGEARSVMALLLDHYDENKYYRARSAFSIEPADSETSRHLRVSLGSALQRVESLYTLEDGTPAFLPIMYFRGDAVRIQAEFREVKLRDD
jgi:DNA-binding GntR family transcriptional regulator